MSQLENGMEKGAKLTYIDPRVSITATKSAVGHSQGAAGAIAAIAAVKASAMALGSSFAGGAAIRRSSLAQASQAPWRSWRDAVPG